MSFSSSTPTVCTVSGSTVTPLAAGTCTIAANQAGNTNYSAAPSVTQNISVAITFPGAPTGVTAIPGNAQATVSFSAPGFNGGSAITGYTVSSTPAGGVDSNAGSGATSHTVTGLSNGLSYTFSVKATNAKGDSAASAASSPVTPNLLTPSIGAPSATLLKSGGTVTYTVSYAGADTVTLAASDITVNKTGTASGSAAVSGSGTASRTVTISGITGDGTLGISIAAGTASASGGAVTAQASAASASFSVDSTAPALSVATLANNTKTSSNTLSITGSASDPNGIQSVTVNGGATLSLTNGAFNTALTLSAGSNTVSVVATDLAGNTTTDTRTVSFDSTLPVVTFSAPTPSGGSFTNQQTVTLAGTLSKAGSVAITLNNGSPIVLTTSGAQNGFSSQPITLAPGPNSISVSASDSDTPPNVAVVPTRTVTYDTTNPVLAVSDPASDITTTFTSYLVQGTESDNYNGSTLAVTVDGVALTPAPTVADDGSFQQSVSFTDGKTYHVGVTATDLAGNSSTVQRNIVYQPFTIADALRALQIASGIVTAQTADLQRLDVGPLIDGKPAPDGIIDLSDTIVLLRLVVGDLDGISW